MVHPSSPTFVTVQEAATAPPLTASQRDTIMAAFAGFTPGGEAGDRR